MKISKELLHKRRQIQRDFNRRKYIFDVENYYENGEDIELKCICPNGHLFMISWRQWQQGYRCPEHKMIMVLPGMFHQSAIVEDYHRQLLKMPTPFF